MTGAVRLEASVRLTNSHLRLDYQVINDSDRGIYAFVLATDAARKTYPHQAYTCLSADRKSLQLLLGETPPPGEISLSYRASPFAAFIESHSRLEDYLDLQLPIHEWHAYDPSNYADGAEEVNVSQLHFELTYLYDEQIFFVDETGEEGFVQVGGFPERKLLFSHRLDEPVRVLARPDDFSRFPLVTAKSN